MNHGIPACLKKDCSFQHYHFLPFKHRSQFYSSKTLSHPSLQIQITVLFIYKTITSFPSNTDHCSIHLKHYHILPFKHRSLFYSSKTLSRHSLQTQITLLFIYSTITSFPSNTDHCSIHLKHYHILPFKHRSQFYSSKTQSLPSLQTQITVLFI